MIPLAEVHHTSFFSAHNDTEVVKPTHRPRRCPFSSTPPSPHEGNRGPLKQNRKSQGTTFFFFFFFYNTSTRPITTGKSFWKGRFDVKQFPWDFVRYCSRGQNWSRTSCDLRPCFKIKHPKHEASFFSWFICSGHHTASKLEGVLWLSILNLMMWIFTLLRSAQWISSSFPWKCVTWECNFL